MDSNDKEEINILDTLKKPYIKISIVITIIIIILMSLTQSYWMNLGIKAIYNEYPISKIDQLKGQIYIVSGNYNDNYLYDLQNSSQKAHIISTNVSICNIQNGYVKLLVTNEPQQNIAGVDLLGKPTTIEDVNESMPRIVIFKVLEGCSN